MALPRKHRVSGAEMRTFRAATRVAGAFFNLAIAKNDSVQCTCVVSKKVAVRATVRNLVKRRCRAAIYRHVDRLESGTYVFTAKRESARANASDIGADIEKLLQTHRSTIRKL